MLTGDALWLVDDSALDEPADVLTIPEIKRHVVHDLHEEGLGLRALLERPEALPRHGWQEKPPRTRRVSAKTARRQSGVLRAA